MTLKPKQTKLNYPTANLPNLEKESEFDWRLSWYPVSFVQDLPKDRPFEFSLYDEPLVIFRNKKDELVCLRNICPHRAAKLSDGQIVDGKLECPYHGWQFGTKGECLHIPQLAENTTISSSACVKSYLVVEVQDMIWLWGGDPETADQKMIPTIPEIEQPGFVCENKAYEYFCAQNFIIENILDPAHVNIIHNGTQAKKKDAQPLEMIVLQTSPLGFKGKWRLTKQTKNNWVATDFIAPNLVFHYFTVNEKLKWNLGLAVYSIPLASNRTRVFVRIFRNFFTLLSKLTPRWINHLGGCVISEEDIKVLMGQQKQIELSQKNLNELYTPLETLDIFVTEYRSWLDKFGDSLPFNKRMSEFKLSEAENVNNSVLIDRFQQHTLICSSCNKAHKISTSIVQISTATALIFFAVALFTNDLKSEIIVLVMILLRIVANIVKTKLETSIFDRRRKA